MHSSYDTFDNLFSGKVVKHFPYETGRIGNVIVRFEDCEEARELHGHLAEKAGRLWPDNKEMFAVEMFGEYGSEPVTIYVMFWDGFMKIGLKGFSVKDDQ